MAGVPMQCRLFSHLNNDIWLDRSETLGTVWKHYDYFVEIPAKGEPGYAGEWILASLRLDYRRKPGPAPCPIWLADVKIQAETL